MILKLVKKILGNANKKHLKRYQIVVDVINQLEPEMQALSDDDLRQKTTTFKRELQSGKSLDTLLPPVFAVVRETAKRVLDMRHFDVQLAGGMVLHENKIAEMRTGEGKTLVATLPAYLNALVGKGVYIVTVNDYLAKRDKEWMGQIYEFLGLTVGLIQSNMKQEDRIKAYEADITYGTNNEFGFDYLRDNLSWDYQDLCQKRRYYAIIDEVDSILIDEARTPLIISGPLQDSTEKYLKIVKIIRHLKKEDHFTLEEKHKNVILTEKGIVELEQLLNLKDLYSITNMDQAHMAIQCIRALYLYQKDVDYVITDGVICIVDEFTGRVLEGRRYSDGLHQAIEAVENVRIQNENQTLASITYQNYFRMFPKLSGMTGTAKTEESEFIKIYALEVIVVPTNQPIMRTDHSDIIFKTKQEKYKAIVKDVKARSEKGQPVLLGTISIATSELLSDYLKKEGVKHRVLNAKFHEKEAEIIKDAGQGGTVTIATNMAGRGTDIVLGEGVTDVGGLCVIGSERHESRRIDNQLRGRCGRQGDPGGSRFYVSLEDDLMRMFGSDRIVRVMETLGLPEDTPIEHKMISKSIEKAQHKVEQYHFGVRKQILQFDDVMDRQRTTIYSLRQQILERRDLDQKVKEIIRHLVASNYDQYFLDQDVILDSDSYRKFEKHLQQTVPFESITKHFEKNKKKETIIEGLSTEFFGFYKERKKQIEETIFEEIVVKRALLISLDRQWMDHLYAMDLLREGIGLRAYGQRDPLIEYKREGYGMFKELLVHIYEEAMSFINRAVIVKEEHHHRDGNDDGNDDVDDDGDDGDDVGSQGQLPQPEFPKPVIDTSTLRYTSSETTSQSSPQVTQQINSEQKRGRNEKVTIIKDGQTRVLKWKKAEVMIQSEGWALAS